MCKKRNSLANGIQTVILNMLQLRGLEKIFYLKRYRESQNHRKEFVCKFYEKFCQKNKIIAFSLIRNNYFSRAHFRKKMYLRLGTQTIVAVPSGYWKEK